ncbi:hypothetical protein TSUD_119760 [Trifolium subterraneum]|uniref:Uncharacterized protein n=1 Tax=Trifolium subterraneum TaxID=3900 RepID=A0A2Z6NQF5_TRISU|nr:hypothetical protein TSUD_119760 [Trifolium subterraneum]
METTRICALISLALCIFISDICMKIEGKEVDGLCNSDTQCQSGCPGGKHAVCDRGRCWCYDSPPTEVAKELDAQTCKSSAECQSGCPKGKRGNVNLDVRKENVQYVISDDVGVLINRHFLRVEKNLMHKLVNQVQNVNLDVRKKNVQYVISDDVGVLINHP